MTPDITTATRIPRAKIHPSPTNPRKTFDEQKLIELAESMKTHGVLEALKVRPHPKKAGEFELIFGERRWRASEIAGLDEVPVVIDDLDDATALEQQLVENTHRIDLTALEEAETYRALRDKHYAGDMDRLVEKTGKSRAHLYGRLKLLELVPAATKAVREGRLAPMCGELIARLDPKVQPEALRDALGLCDFEGYEEINVIPEGIGEQTKGYIKDGDHQPLSFRALQALIHRKYMLRLAEAPFSIHDETLNKEAGACTACPHRSGNQPELLPDLKKPEDSCTKPACFETKVKAAWQRSLEHHKAKDPAIKIITGKDAKNIFGHDGKPTYNGEYVSLDQELPHDIARPGSKATFGKLLGKAEADLPKVLVQDERGAPHVLIEKKAAVKLLKEAGKIDEATKPAASSEEREARAKDKAKRELRTEAFRRIVEDLGARAKEFEVGGKKTAQLCRWLARAILEGGCYGAAEFLRPIYDIKEGADFETAIGKVIDEARTGGDALAIAVALAVASVSQSVISEAGGERAALFESACDLFGADWGDAVKRAKDAAKAEAASDAAKKKDEPAKAEKPAKKKGGKK